MVARGNALVVALLISGTVAGGPPSPAAATRAFGHWLQKRYVAPKGYWTCPADQRFDNRADCTAEVRVGQKHHFVEATGRLSRGRVVFSRVHDEAWVRRWSRYSHRPIAGFDTPGKASVNSPAFDWAFLAQGLQRPAESRTSFRVNSHDGYSAGLGKFFIFRCVVRGDLATCRNAFGDAMRYKPRA